MSRSPSRATRRAARNTRSQEKGARPYGGLSIQERRAERRTRLLHAGLELFGTRGYASTPIELICASASVTARHFYEQFASREALLLAVYDTIVRASRQAVLTALRQSQSNPERRITAGLSAYVSAVMDDPRHARITCLEVGSASAASEQRRRTTIHEMAKIVEAQAQQLAAFGRVAPRDFRMTAIALAGAINELVTDAVSRLDPPSQQTLVETLTRIVLAVVADARAPKQAETRSMNTRAPRRTKSER